MPTLLYWSLLRSIVPFSFPFFFQSTWIPHRNVRSLDASICCTILLPFYLISLACIIKQILELKIPVVNPPVIRSICLFLSLINDGSRLMVYCFLLNVDNLCFLLNVDNIYIYLFYVSDRVIYTRGRDMLLWNLDWNVFDQCFRRIIWNQTKSIES